MQPESVDPRSPTVDVDRDAEEDQAVGDRHRGRPVPAPRKEIGDEEPGGAGDREHEQRELEGAQGERRGDHSCELEHEQPEAETSEHAAVGVGKPTEPGQQSAEEHDEGGDGAEGVEAGGDETAAPLGQERKGGENDERECRPADEPGGPMFSRLDRQEGQHGHQDRDSTRIGQKGSGRPRRTNRVHHAEL